MLHVRVFFSVLHIKKEIPRSTNLVASGSEIISGMNTLGRSTKYLGIVPLHFNSRRNLEGVARSNLVKKRVVFVLSIL